MTDAEVICNFMEPEGANYRRKWWQAILKDGRLRVDNPVEPVTLTLDRLHEVEARLTVKQRMDYAEEFGCFCGFHVFNGLHATADQKIKALATILRSAAKEATDAKE